MRFESCKEVAVLLSKRLDGELNTKERLRLWVHLAICDICRALGRQLKEQQTIARQADTQLPGLPDASKNRIIDEMKKRP